MFTFKEMGIIVAALQFDKTTCRDAVLQKIESMVSRQTIRSVMPCVRPTRDSDTSDRAKVFESERELIGDIQKIALGGNAKVMVCVPMQRLVEVISESVGRSLERFGTVRCRKGNIECDNGLTVQIVAGAGEHTLCGYIVDWAFFYNEVAGF